MTELLERYGRANLPRYTSYPTAAQFHDGVSEADYRRWLAEVRPGADLSLYAHVPFCESLCWYCGCHTSVPNGYERVARYVATLRREIALTAEAARAARLDGTVRHLHFGGGTPSMLAPADFAAVVGDLRALFPFAEDAEVAIEADPRTLSDVTVEGFVAAGVNRVSFGVQDLNPEVQRLINRVQPAEQVADAVSRLRAAGIGALNFDLIYGLPAQTVADMEASARFTAALGVDRVAVFGYAHVPWFKKHQKAIPEDRLPDLEDRLAQAEAAARIFEEAGYVRIGLDHYAHPDDPLAASARAGTLRRNFQGYTTDVADALLAFGASAIGALPGGFVQNAPHLKDYGQAVADGRLPAARGVAVTEEDRLRAAAIERMMCDMTVDTGSVCRRFGMADDALDDAFLRLAELEADGLVTVDGRRVALTEKGRPYLRNAAAAFDAHLAAARAAAEAMAAKPRHSLAV